MRAIFTGSSACLTEKIVSPSSFFQPVTRRPRRSSKIASLICTSMSLRFSSTTMMCSRSCAHSRKLAMSSGQTMPTL